MCISRKYTSALLRGKSRVVGDCIILLPPYRCCLQSCSRFVYSVHCLMHPSAAALAIRLLASTVGISHRITTPPTSHDVLP